MVVTPLRLGDNKGKLAGDRGGDRANRGCQSAAGHCADRSREHFVCSRRAGDLEEGFVRFGVPASDLCASIRILMRVVV